MTNEEIKEIEVVFKNIIEDDCDEIRDNYKKKYGNFKGYENYIKNELIAFWTDFNPYLDKEYLDYCFIKYNDKIINYDGIWCFIRDCLKEN